MPKITVYSRQTCAPCVALKRFLQMKGYRYTEVSIDEQPDKMKDVISLSGFAMVPCTVVDNGDSRQVIAGYNLASLATALQQPVHHAA